MDLTFKSEHRRFNAVAILRADFCDVTIQKIRKSEKAVTVFNSKIAKAIIEKIQLTDDDKLTGEASWLFEIYLILKKQAANDAWA